MAKHAPKTNALGMNLDPESFEVEKKEITPVEPQKVAEEKIKPIVSVEEELVEETKEDSVEVVLKEIANPRSDKRRGYSLYLSESVMKEATKRAKAAGYKTPAPYIDEVLKRVFQL